MIIHYKYLNIGDITQALQRNFLATAEMYLQYVEKDGKRVYTLKKVIDGKVSRSAHPGRYQTNQKNCLFTPAVRLDRLATKGANSNLILFVSLIYGCSISMIG
jgi:hypothetical protein